MSPRPPRILRALFTCILPDEDQRFVLDDLEETFAHRAAEHGVRAAGRWYAYQFVRSLPLAVYGARDLLPTRMGRDLRGALRLLRHRPLWALGISGTLGLGLAAGVILGQIAWGVWLRPLPFPDSENLVRIWELGRPDESGQRERGRISPPLLRDLTEASFAHLAGFAGLSGTAPEWRVTGNLRTLAGTAVSPGFFELVGLTPLAGRTAFTSRATERVPEVVLSDAFWQRDFGGNPDVIGTTIDLDDTSHVVIGVVAPAGGWPPAVDVYTPLVFEERRLGEGMRGARYLEVIARVESGSTIESADAEFAAFIKSLGEAHPIHAGWSGEVVSLRRDLVGPFQDVLRLLLAAGAAFLILAVGNVTGLAATRGIDSRPERAVRLALGASRMQLLRQAGVEGAVLGALGGGIALICGLIVLPLSVGWAPAALIRTGEIGLSPANAVGWWMAAVFAGAGVGIVGHSVGATGAKPGNGPRATRSGQAVTTLVAVQLALTTLLVGIGAVVLERSGDLAKLDLGFDPDERWSTFVSLPGSTHEDQEARRDTWTALLNELEEIGIPAALSVNPPMTGMNANYGFRRPEAAEDSFGQYAIISPEWFRVMGIALRSGRTFEPGEDGPVTIISEELAKEHFPNEDPLGQSITVLMEDLTIIGVVASTSHFGPDTPMPPKLYVPYESVNWNFATVVVQGGSTVSGRLADAVSRTVFGARPEVVPYHRHVSEWFRPLRIQLGIVGGLGIVGAVLAGLGLYANLAWQVRGRLPELGIRVALGATKGRVVTRVVRQGLTTAGAGIGLGIFCWWGAGFHIAEVLGAGTASLSTFAVSSTAVVVLLLTLGAAVLPALRAAKADPLETLRHE